MNRNPTPTSLITQYIMETRFSTLLVETRKKQKVTLEQLSDGLCTVSQLSKIEKAGRIPTRALQKRLLERLGLDLISFENFLQADDYAEWKERKTILDVVESGALEQAECLLQCYANHLPTEESIEKQFYYVMQAQCLQKELTAYEQTKEAVAEEIQKRKDAITALYEKAVAITIPDVETKPLRERKLAVVEVNMLLEYQKGKLERQSATGINEIADVYRELLSYIETMPYSMAAQAEIYPKAVVFMYSHLSIYLKRCDTETRLAFAEEMLKKVGKAIELLQERGVGYYLTELLDIQITLIQELEKEGLQKAGNKAKEWEQLRTQAQSWRLVLKKLYEKYEVSETVQDCCYMYREKRVYCLNDVIRKRRKMLRMTKAALCEGICSDKTLTRLEKGQCHAQSVVVAGLLERLALSAEYLHQEIITGKREVLEQFEKFGRVMNEYDYEYAAKMLEEIEEKLEDSLLNRQVIEKYRNRILFGTNQMTIEQYREASLELLEYTIPVQSPQETAEFYLTESEVIQIYHLAVCYKEIGEYEKSYEVIRSLYNWCQGCEQEGTVENHMVLYSFIMKFVSSLIGSMGRYEESNRISEELIRVELKINRLHQIPLLLYNFAWNENERGSLTKEEYNEKVNQCISLSELCKDKYMAGNMKKELLD